jgi:hypothetical protein
MSTLSSMYQILNSSTNNVDGAKLVGCLVGWLPGWFTVWVVGHATWLRHLFVLGDWLSSAVSAEWAGFPSLLSD